MSEQLKTLISTVSPHTRGWTLRAHPRQRPPLGFPAHAGMDPCPGDRDGGRCWFPRTRGDGPWRISTGSGGRAVSPHTRGWTLSDAATPAPAIGFPAHAGMDPDFCAVSSFWFRFPRTRGDGPLQWGTDSSPIGVSPHTRGWTAHRHLHRALVRGFPAHAGMDRAHPGPRQALQRFPRTRGDGPWARPSGGSRLAVSPHTRGWTPLPGGMVREFVGFPAHAGMDHGR